MIMPNPSNVRYASEKFFDAVYSLAIGPGDVRSRLLTAWESLWDLDPEYLPEKLRKDFFWIKEQLHRYNEEWPGQLENLRKKEEAWPNLIKENYPHSHPTPVEATLKRIQNKTGVNIAMRIFYIYDSLESIVRGA